MSESQDIENETPNETIRGDADTASADAGVESLQASNGNTPVDTENPSEISDAEFEDPGNVSQAPAIAAALIVNVEGYEGPLDVLLMLARSQKVDLKTISILELVDQYLVFIQEAKKMHLDLAADYLVMAAWLTYLKSRLLIPEQEKEDDQPSGEEMAARLAFQLQRLQAMREAGARLMARDRLGIQTFSRGMPEGIRYVRKPDYQADMFEMLKAYSDGRIRSVSHEKYHYRRAPVFAVEDARKRIERMFGKMQDWSSLDSFLPEGWVNTREEGVTPEHKKRSATASTFTASLELAKEGHIEIKQLAHFGPIYVKWRDSEAHESKADVSG